MKKLRGIQLVSTSTIFQHHRLCVEVKISHRTLYYTDFKFVRDKNEHYAEAYADFLGEIFKSSVSHKGTSKF